MNFDDINATNFIDARSFEIQKLENKISKSTKKTLLFQRVPFHKRRRARNKLGKKKKIKNNKGKFIFYHKRFEMLKLYNALLPSKRRQKSESFIVKSVDRGFVFVEKHKKVLLYEKMEGDNTRIQFRRMYYGNEEFEIYDFSGYMIIIGMHAINIQGLTFVSEIGVSLSVFKGSKIITGMNIDEFLVKVQTNEEIKEKNISYVSKEESNGMQNFNSKEIGKQKHEIVDFQKQEYTKSHSKNDKNIVVKNETHVNNVKANGEQNKKIHFSNAFVISGDDFQTHKIIVLSNDLASLHHEIIKEGYIPICINELFRLSIENKKFIYPFDSVKSKYYKEFEKVYYSAEMEKWERTPKAKRINHDKLGVKNPWFIPVEYLSENVEKNNCRDLKLKAEVESNTYFFECKSGSISRMGMIYCENEIVGYVLRGCYCFKIGICRGICVLKEKCDIKNLKLRNKTSLKFHDIEIV